VRIEAALVEFLRRSGCSPIRGKAQGDANFPRLHYWMVSDEGEQTVTRGESANSLAHFRFEAIGRGEHGYEDARALLDAAAAATGGVTGGLDLIHFRGWMPPPPASTGRVWIQSCRHGQTLAEDEQQPIEPRAKSLYVVGFDLTIAYWDGA